MADSLIIGDCGLVDIKRMFRLQEDVVLKWHAVVSSAEHGLGQLKYRPLSQQEGA